MRSPRRVRAHIGAVAAREAAATEVADYPESGTEVLRRAGAPGPAEVGDPEGARVADTEFREVFHSRHGAFGQQWVEEGGREIVGPVAPIHSFARRFAARVVSRGVIASCLVVGCGGAGAPRDQRGTTLSIE